MILKEKYAHNHRSASKNSLDLNKRLFSTYNKISQQNLNRGLTGINIDLGCGDRGFTKYLNSINIESYAYDFPSYDIEKDSLDHSDGTIDFITMNAVIEHIENPDNIFQEINRTLKPQGLVFIRTPNWLFSYKEFFNDPTHVKPYTPDSLKHLISLYGLSPIFIEPGLVGKNSFWWKLPEYIKWYAASKLIGGTKSIIAVGMKRQ